MCFGVKNVSFNSKLKFAIHTLYWQDNLEHFSTTRCYRRFLNGPHLTAQSGELAEGDDQIVENITETIVSCYHCTFPAKTETQIVYTLKPHRTPQNITNCILTCFSSSITQGRRGIHTHAHTHTPEGTE